MKHPVRVISLAVLVFLLGSFAFAYAQDGQSADQAKPKQHAQQKQQTKQNEKAQKGKPAQHTAQNQKARQARPKQHAQQNQKARQAKPTQHAQQNQKARQARPTQHAQQNQKARQARPTQRTQQASNNGGGRIPQARFRAHFGRNHSFRINRPVMVSGSPRFQYGGYWFGFGEPWPVGWSYTDQVYVDYINGGYCLLDPVHPGVQLSINVIL